MNISVVNGLQKLRFHWKVVTDGSFIPPPPPTVNARVMWPHGRPRPSQAPRCLALPTTQPPLCRTHDNGACLHRLWLQLRRWSVWAGTLHCQLPPLSPSPHSAAPSRRAVPAIGWALPGISGGGWVFVPSPPPPSVLPPSGSGHCGGSQGFDSLGFLILSGGQYIP